ncbi:hypothetical protein BFL28_13510 [Sphingomonas turrisvirgatae]|uniref:Uncharacterized protein n=1 Tax=Sphingomonas turrisvirgatae TaxID=1888892 RepID=A0A1E3LYL4_9SPHN|nr:hypothetical protein BFL28_13510 [Sphingomonas turrisvirgatae]
MVGAERPHNEQGSDRPKRSPNHLQWRSRAQKVAGVEQALLSRVSGNDVPLARLGGSPRRHASSAGRDR